MTTNQLTSLIPNQMIHGWESRGLSQATVHLRRKYLAQLLRMLEWEGTPRTTREALTKIRKPRPRATIATPEELDRLLAHADPWEHCLLTLTAGHGVRIGEAEAISAANYNANTGTMTFKTKGAGQNTLPVTEELRGFFEGLKPEESRHTPIVQIYYDREWPKNLAKQLAQTGRKKLSSTLTRQYIYACWTRLKKRASVNPDLRIHDLRRTLAVKTYDLTKDLRLVQQLLGHTNLQTTTLYLEHRDPEKMRDLLTALGTHYTRRPDNKESEQQNASPERLN